MTLGRPTTTTRAHHDTSAGTSDADVSRDDALEADGLPTFGLLRG